MAWVKKGTKIREKDGRDTGAYRYTGTEPVRCDHKAVSERVSMPLVSPAVLGHNMSFYLYHSDSPDIREAFKV
jgi:hypothetical protein